MTRPRFSTFAELLAFCTDNACSIGDAALQYEASLGDRTQDEVLAQSKALLAQMRETIRSGLYSEEKSLSGLTGGFAKKVITFMDTPQAFLSPLAHKMMAYALATLEENSRMRKIVACPTAGASGVVPAILVAMAEDRNIDDDVLAKALLAAGAVGELVSRRMYLSGAAGGCQAEVGVATGMAASALVELLGGSPQQALDACAIAFKNMMGLVCDPVAGLVEVPCVKRNSVAGLHAAAAATLSLSGVYSFIPLDEVVEAMVQVGQMMSPKLKESAEGGLAQTPTALAFTEKLQGPKPQSPPKA